MSMVVRYATDGVQSNVPGGVYEHFILFSVEGSSAKENLNNTLIYELKTLGLYIENICRQGYDNGANMKGHSSYVQVHNNSKIFFTLCTLTQFDFGIVLNLKIEV